MPNATHEPAGHGQVKFYTALVTEPLHPVLSVLIGCWNNATTLVRAVDSILNQTHRDLELIVVDDGSTDNTASLVEETAANDDRIRHLKLPHLGIALSLNAGLNASRGEFVAFQDADDWSLPNRLQRQLEVMRARRDVAVVGCKMEEVAPDGSQVQPRTKFAPGDVNPILLRFNPIPNSCAMVRRSLTLALGGFNPRYRYAMDYDLWLRLAEFGLVTTIDETLAVRTMSGQNVAARNERAQTAEAIRIRASAIRRRRSPRALTSLLLPSAALLTPLTVKRGLRRVRGQAP